MTSPQRYDRIAFVASGSAEAQDALAQLDQDVRQPRRRRCRCRGGARRRWIDAADAAPAHALGQADLRHASRHRRLPDERIHRARSAHAAGGGAGIPDQPAADARHRRSRRGAPASRDQRGRTVSPDQSGGASAHPDRRARAHGGIDRRRHPGGDAGRLDRLQSLGAGADPADQRGTAGADPDRSVPPAALARRPPPQHRLRGDRGARGRQAPGRRRGRPRRVRDVRRVEVLSDRTISMRMLFDPGHSLEERILREQFGY